ncbi:TPA: hypothetical protein ACH3X1_006809 [Trebouxia sp. C0004]
MGFKADADQGTETEQAGQNKLQDGAPLPVEKPDQTQQSAIDVIGQIQKDAARGERIPLNLAFLDTHQAPCMVVIGQHFEDGRFMATFLNQVIAWANKACDSGYPDTCLHWAGFLAKLAIHYDRVSAGHADVGIMNRLTSRARSLKALGESRASDRMSKGKRVHGITGVLIEWGMDEYRLIETVTERLRTVNDAIRYCSLALNFGTHGCVIKCCF